MYKKEGIKFVTPTDNFEDLKVSYDKRDPFGVNMRLRQSLSNTNMILFKLDTERYMDEMT